VSWPTLFFSGADLAPFDFADKIDLGMPPVIELVQKHLPVILNLLTHPPVRAVFCCRSEPRRLHPFTQKPTELKTQFGALNPPFGETRMKAVELLLVPRLLLTSSPVAPDFSLPLAICAGAVPQQLPQDQRRSGQAEGYPSRSGDSPCITLAPRLALISFVVSQECFLAYPWNNMLHGLVESILRTVIDSDSEVLKKSVSSCARRVCGVGVALPTTLCGFQLFQESKLVDIFIRGHKMNVEAAYVRSSSAHSSN
jgi:hypothetical protein